MTKVEAVSSLALIVIGIVDWLTTTFGIFFFKAVESNPFISGVAGTSLPTFTILKLSVALFAGLLFYQGDRILLRTTDKSTQSFKCTRTMLNGACIAATIFLSIAVLNNLVVIFSSI